MAAVDELVLGAVLGAVVTELVLLAKAATTEAATFKNRVEDLKSDLYILHRKINELDSCTEKLEAEKLIERGRKLVHECSTVRLLNLVKIKCCASKLSKLKSLISESVRIIDLLFSKQQHNSLRNELKELQQRESTVRDGSSSVSDSNLTQIDSFTEEIHSLPAPEVPEFEACVSSKILEAASGPLNEGDVGDLVVGASVETGVAELYDMVEGTITKSSMFNTQLKQLKSTLEFIAGLSPEMLITDLDGTSREILKRGKQLLNECSTVNFWNLPQRYLYAKKLLQQDRLILKIFESVIQLQMIKDSKIIMEEIKVTLGAGRVGAML